MDRLVTTLEKEALDACLSLTDSRINLDKVTPGKDLVPVVPDLVVMTPELMKVVTIQLFRAHQT